jgi:RNA polymerase sigma-70 factor (ECF subfamily)
METRVGAPSIIELFERLGDGVYTLAVRMLGDRHLAEDVVQETFLRALRKLHTWRGDGSIDGWIYRIGYRQAIAQARRRRDLPTAPDELPDAIAVEAGPERQALTRELAARIDAALAELTMPLRAAFVLRDVEGLSTAAVAEALGISESATKMRLKRARVALRTRLEDYL